MPSGAAVRTGMLMLLAAAAGWAQKAALKARMEEPAPAVRRQAPRLLPRRFTPGWGHYLAPFDHRPGREELEALAAAGIRFVAFIPHLFSESMTLVVAAPDGAGLDGAPRMEPADKISPLIPEGGEGEGADTFLVEFHPDIDMDQARALVDGEEFRSLGVERVGHPDLLANQLLVRGRPEAVLTLAGWDEVAYVFPASDELKNGERVAACAGAAGEPGVIGQYVKVGSGWPSPAGTFGGPANLLYVFGAMTPKLAAAPAQAEIARALDEWTRYGNVRFSPGLSPTDPRTVSILFASQAHGDPFPFDGPGRVLAHTFYPAPLNAEPIAGDIHLDGDEGWRIGVDTDLYSVALHEAGHALGLGHSDKPGAVMYPYYRISTGLTADDIQGIQSLYGAAAGGGAAPVPAPSPAPVPAPSPTPALAITSPSGPAVTQSESITMGGTSSGAARISWANSLGGAGSIVPAANWSAGPIALQPGENVLTVTAVSAAGAALSRSVSVTRIPAPDRTAPSLTILSPASSIVSTSAASISLSGTASDNSGVTAVRWSCSCGLAGDATGTVLWRADSIPLRVGTSTITVRAYDAAGNSGWRSLTVVRR